MLKNLLSKSMYTGLGLLVLTKEKVEEMLEKMVDEGSISEERAREMVENMISQAEKERKKIEEKMQEYIEQMMKKAGFVTRKEFSELEQMYQQLQLKMETIEREVKELKQNKEDNVS